MSYSTTRKEGKGRWNLHLSLRTPHPPQVEYQCEGFLEKNRDTVYETLVETMQASTVRGEGAAEAAIMGWTDEGVAAHVCVV